MSTLNQPFKTDLHTAVSAAVNTHTNKRWSQGQFAPELQILMHNIALTHVSQSAALSALVQNGASVSIARRVLAAIRDEAPRRIQMEVSMAKLDAFVLGVQVHDLIVPCHSPAIGLFDDEGLQVNPNDSVLPIHATLMATSVQQILNWNALKAYMAAHCPDDGDWTSKPASVFNWSTEEGRIAVLWAATHDDLVDQIESLSEPECADTNLSLLLLRDLRRAALSAMVMPH